MTKRSESNRSGRSPKPSAGDKTLSLSPAEWQVMKVLWDSGQAAARDVHAALPESGWSDRTVKTMLSRLVAKGAVAYEQIGNSYLYRPAIEQIDATRDEVRSVVERVKGSSMTPLLAAFVDEVDLDNDDLDALQEMIDAKRAADAKASDKASRSGRSSKSKKRRGRQDGDQ